MIDSKFQIKNKEKQQEDVKKRAETLRVKYKSEEHKQQTKKKLRLVEKELESSNESQRTLHASINAKVKENINMKEELDILKEQNNMYSHYS